MEHKTKIVLDTKGGDRGASALVKGAALALERFPQLEFVLAGDEAALAGECAALNIPRERAEILDAPGEITNYDNPAEAFYTKADSSLLRGLDTLSSRDDLFGMITCGSTGAALTGAMRYLSGEHPVRPALAAVLPAQTGGFTCLVDTGATIDCTSAMLCHFAHLGSDFMRSMYGIENPKVGLLSNGSEPTKGNKLVKETHPLLAADGELNFVGNVEGSEALSGVCDVLVCDGFAGNQVLKVTEGTAKRMMTDIMRYAKKTGSADAEKLFFHLMGVYDIGALGGGIILGVTKPVIKARGNADERAVVSVAEMLLNMAEHRAVFDRNRNHI